ncbi:MAG TPA: LysR family transcriptional regulator [Candidatus Methylomirabilis sp.]|nr:LysR family transcriptional regulator [Candidatus Methylomirabilis sp.]
MRLQSLRALQAVMETGSTTEAGKRLYRTQPQVSRLIAALEEELGFKLFLRDRRRLLPTQEGSLFYAEVRRILSGLEEISKVAEDIRAHKEARLRIVSQPYLAHAVLPDALAAFARSHPNLRYSLEIRSRGDVGSWVAGHQFDLGVVALPIDVPGVSSQPFATVQVLVAFPVAHPLARKKRLKAEDLLGQPFIALRPYTLLRHLVDELFAQLHLPLTIRAETSFGLAACQMVAKGLGITLTDPLVARCLPPGQIELREWEPGLSLPYGFLFSSTHPPLSVVLDFADTVAETTKRLAPEYVRLTGKKSVHRR